jgi:hypothetical protein
MGERKVEELQSKAMKALVSLVEGRQPNRAKDATGATANTGEAEDSAVGSQRTIHQLLSDKLETSLLRLRLITNHKKLVEMEMAQDSGIGGTGEGGAGEGGVWRWLRVASRTVGCCCGSNGDDTKKRRELEAKAKEKRKERVLGEVRDMLALVEQLSDCCEKVESEMKPMTGQSTGGISATTKKTEAQLALHEQVAYADALRFFHRRLERVEIVWNHRLERMLFVKPPLAEMHTDLEKQGMTDKLDFMDATRMTTFIEVRARACAARRAHTPSDFDVVQQSSPCVASTQPCTHPLLPRARPVFSAADETDDA